MNTEKEAKILKEARERLHKAMQEDLENRRFAKEDLEFIAVEGKQWPDSIRAERIAEGRPCLSINKMPAFVDQVVGDQRMNRPAIAVVPVDSKSDPRTAQVLGGWIKHVQQISKSDVAVDHAFEHAVACGYGALRVITKYTSDSSFEQDAYVEKIDNALAVFWGKHSQYDASDAMYCFVISDLDREEFKAQFGVEAAGFKSEADQFADEWFSKDTVRVAEYFVKEPVQKTIYLLEDGRAVDKLEQEDVVVRERKVKAHKIMWYLLSGDKVLDVREWLGKKYIPVVPVWGKEISVAGKRVVRGLIRNAKDSQRMFNYWSALSLDTLIPCPDGWLTMADMQVGYQVFDEKGKVCTVTNVSPVYEDRPCYEVLFDDGTVIVADETHLWEVEERSKRVSKGFIWNKKVIMTKELEPKKHFIYVNGALDLPEKNFSIPPYVLGVWLGDGDSIEPSITQSLEDAPYLFAHLKRFGCTLSEPHSSIRDVNTERRTMLGMRHKFVELNLLNNKHIPYDYVRGSIQQRLELLQGLMDTDGSVNGASGSCDFTTVRKELAKGFIELLRSLGIKATYVIRDRGEREIRGKMCDTQRVYQFYFTTRLPVFRLARKFEKLDKRQEEIRRTGRHSIVSITPIMSVPVQCISVDSPSSLYLAGAGMIPTHNSLDTELIALQPKSPYILTPKQIAGYEDQWNEAHRKNYPYLLANPDKDAPGWPHREAPPQLSSAVTQRLAETDQEIRDTIGLQKASMGMQSNERSGAAIRERKLEGDVGVFAFIDNLSRSLEHVGRILVDIAPALLDTERIIRIGLEDGAFDFVGVNMVDPSTQNLLNDLSLGTYDVVVTTGPSFTTQRTEARESMKEFIQYYPAAAPFIGDIYAKVMDWAGADQLSKRLEYMLPPEVRALIEEEKLRKEGRQVPPKQPEQPTPEQQVAMKELEVRAEEAKIKLEQERVKLQGLKVKNELMVNASKERLKSMLREAETEIGEEDLEFSGGGTGEESQNPNSYTSPSPAPTPTLQGLPEGVPAGNVKI